MHRLNRAPDPGQLPRLLAVGISSLTVATGAVALFETYLGVPNASIIYLAAVVATAIAAGTLGAILTAVASVVLYDYFFTVPYQTLTVSDPGEWLSVILLLFVGIVVGQLAAMQRAEAEEARRNEREANAISTVSRALATRNATPTVLGPIARVLGAETRMTRIWIALDDAPDSIAADTGEGRRPQPSVVQHVLQPMPDGGPARWQRLHQPGTGSSRSRPVDGDQTYRVRIESGGTVLGSIWCSRARTNGVPDPIETRLLAASADQIGQALANDRLAAEARALEIARQGNEIKTALLQSVSHDLRTPLGTIRTAAGTIRPRNDPSAEDLEASADAIDREVDYLNRLVTNLLDLSRIEAGALRVDRDVFDLDDIVRATIDRMAPRLAGRPLLDDLLAPPVDADPILLDQAVTNVLDNAVKHTPPGTAVRVRARAVDGEPFVRLTIEDAGPGVPEPALGQLFDKFYQVPGTSWRSRSGTGIGLAVVRGLGQAMGGRVRARPSELGGLAVDLDLPRASVPAALAEEPRE